MIAILRHMDWTLVLWTGLSWMFSGGILYLVYQLGNRMAAESGVKINSLRTIALLLGFLVCLAMFGTDYPDKGLLIEFSSEDHAVFLGIFLIVAGTYILGYIDSRRDASARTPEGMDLSGSQNAPLPPT